MPQIVISKEANYPNLTKGKEYQVIREDSFGDVPCYKIIDDSNQRVLWAKIRFILKEETPMPQIVTCLNKMGALNLTENKEYNLINQIKTHDNTLYTIIGDNGSQVNYSSIHFSLPKDQSTKTNAIINQQDHPIPQIVISNVNFAPLFTKGKEYQVLRETTLGITKCYCIIGDDNHENIYAQSDFTIKEQPMPETMICINNLPKPKEIPMQDLKIAFRSLLAQIDTTHFSCAVQRQNPYDQARTLVAKEEVRQRTKKIHSFKEDLKKNNINSFADFYDNHLTLPAPQESTIPEDQLFEIRKALYHQAKEGKVTPNAIKNFEKNITSIPATTHQELILIPMFKEKEIHTISINLKSIGNTGINYIYTKATPDLPAYIGIFHPEKGIQIYQA